mgnify:CR=1 FL=1
MAQLPTDPGVAMNKLPAARGLAWFSGSLMLLKAQPLRLLLIGLVLQFLMGLTQLSALGLLLIMAVPALTAGVMEAMSIVERGFRPSLVTLFSAFSDTQKVLRLFIISLVMIAAGLLSASILLSGVAGSLDQEFLNRIEQGDVDALATADPALIQSLATALLVGLFISGSLAYFSVPLVWFRGLPAGTAILEGLVGMLKNWLPFLVLGALLAVVALPVGILSATLLANALMGGQASALVTLLMMLLMVAYQLLVFGAQYLSFKEIFGTGQDQPETRPDDNQLVA